MKPGRDHLISLDALRGVAALSVAIPHFYISNSRHSAAAEFVSIIAVEVFFVLSGFVLAPQILRCLSGPRDLMTFYARRWMRTLPPYLLILTALAIVGDHFGDRDFLQYLAFVRNFVGISDAGEFFAPAWSLAVEEWFYLMFPLFMLAALKVKLAPIRAAVGLLLAFVVVKCAVAITRPDLLESARRVVIWRIDAISFGFVLFMVIDRLPKWLPAPATALGIGASAWAASTHNEVAFMYGASLFGCALLATSRLAEPWFNRHRMITTVAAFLAATSYTVYLLHVLVLALIGDWGTGPAEFVVYLTILFAGAALFYRFVERPMLDARPRYGGNQITGYRAVN